MAKLTINSGNRHIDGEYELDLSGGFEFTKNEWFLMNKRVGVTVDDMRPGSKIDINVATALGLVMLVRAGKEALLDVFMETTDSQTVWEWESSEVEEVEDESVPLPTGSDDAAGRSGSGVSSGPNTNGGSELSPDETRAAIGSRHSATTPTSAPATSVTSLRAS